MFDIEEFTKHIKNKHGQDITIEPGVELQKVVDSFRCDYFLFLEHTAKVIESNYMFAFQAHNHSIYIPIFTLSFDRTIKSGNKNFAYVNCYSEAGRVFVFFYRERMQAVYNCITRIERLKAFL